MRSRFPLSPLAAALLPLFLSPLALAESVTAGTLRVDADQVSGQMDVALKAEGHVEARRDDQTVNADWLEYYVDRQLLRAGDRVRLTQQDGTIEAAALEASLATRTGSGQQARFAFGQAPRVLRGEADRFTLQGRGHYQLQQARANTCEPGDDAWYLKAGTIDLDYDRNVGVARNARLEFQGVPILYTPWIDFPLDGGRKSGVMFPTVTTGSDGLEVAVPYYWNIAPNYDATITPRYFQQRGMMLGVEGRYLTEQASGQLYTEQLPGDRKARGDRSLWRVEHTQQLSDTVRAGLNGTRVSDNQYFVDFGSRSSVAANVNLLREAWMTYTPSWGAVSVRAQRYQTLQDSTGSVEAPYARVPQVVASASQPFGAFTARLESELTRFDHADKQTGWRTVAYPSLHWGLDKSWGFLAAKLGVHHTQYQLDAFNGQAATTKTRTLPVATVDAGLTFERDSQWLGRSTTQTLEPRLFYVDIPATDQSDLPNFDTSENDFNFAQLFSENRFSGYDRINAARQITSALTSRWLDNASGLERLRVAIGQRFYLDNDNTTLNGSTTRRTEGASDLLLNLGGDLDRALRLDATYQHNQTLNKTERYSAQLRYTPATGQTLSVRYRYGRDEVVGSNSSDRDSLRQVDVAAQWPLAPRWYGVARQNYSLRDRKALEQLAGLEYNQGCWTFRLVGQRYVTDVDKRKTAIFFQLELKDLSSLGNNPLNELRLAIPGYSNLNE